MLRSRGCKRPSPQAAILAQNFRIHSASAEHVANIADRAAACEPEEAAPAQQRCYQGPKRVLRTCPSSMACSKEFGRQMEREARRRRSCEAQRKVFVSDGQAWNWSIWEDHFPDYEQVLDFIRVIQYLYAAAEAAEQTGTARWQRHLKMAAAVCAVSRPDAPAGLAWQRFLKMADAVWQGRVDEVITELENWWQRIRARPLRDAQRMFRRRRAPSR